ncbi:MAG TPA: hypothetical protein VLN49_11600 [Gemmatimonadaceae bacterium]|nr:hypothetical protein [Gemmatimonadaceae bacterium]
MTQDRREFLERIATGAMLATFPTSIDALGAFRSQAANAAAEEFDLTWVNRVTGKYRAVFDVPEIDSGYGVWRASLWVTQYMDVLKADARDCSPVLVLRHKGIALSMTQAFWDKYGVAKENKVTHPVTQQGTDRNPALLSSLRNEVPADFDDAALDKFIGRGGIVLACNLAFDDMIQLVSKKDGTTGEAARKTALAGIVPGVILQPSGVFAALRAQDAGCKYLRAS